MVRRQDRRLTFDFAEGGESSAGATWKLAYSPTLPLNFSFVDVPPVVNGDRYSFDLTGSKLATGYYTVMALPLTGTVISAR